MEVNNILGVKINTGFTMASALEYIQTKLLSDGKSHYICTTNPEFIMKAQEDSHFKDIINKADLSLPDGIGVAMALEYNNRVSQLKKNNVFPARALMEGLTVGFKGKLAVERIAGMSLVYNLIKVSAEKKYSIFLLGGRRRSITGALKDNSVDVATLAARNIKKYFPNVTIIGATSEFTFKESDDYETLKFLHESMDKHNVSHIDILLVAYNFCDQEKWIVRNAHKIPAKLSIGVGRTLDNIAFNADLSIMNNAQKKTEWFMSLIRIPWKIKRVLTAFPAFPLRVFLSSLPNK